MAKKRLSTDAIELYNKEVNNFTQNILDFYTGTEKIAKEIDSIAESCSLSTSERATDGFTRYNSETAKTHFESKCQLIEKDLTKTEEKIMENDQILKTKITERSNEVVKLKGIISQYKDKVSESKRLDAAGLVSGLKGIGAASGIDKIQGVNDGRQKRLDREVRVNKLLTKEELTERISEMYRNLTKEELDILVEYYTFKNIKNGPMTAQPLAMIGVDVVLIYENGKYRLEYYDTTKHQFLETSLSANANLFNPSLSSDVDMKKNSENSFKKGSGMNAKLEGSLLSGSIDNVDYSIVNGDISAKVNKDGISVSAGGSLAKIDIVDITVWENDLYKYTGNLKVTIVSGEIKAGLTKDGIEIGTPGLIGIDISGGRVDLIDINTNL